MTNDKTTVFTVNGQPITRQQWEWLNTDESQWWWNEFNKGVFARTIDGDKGQTLDDVGMAPLPEFPPELM